MEIRTTDCKEAGQREFVFRFDDPGDASLATKWAEALTLDAFEGKGFAAGDRLRLWGAWFRLEAEGDELALHEDDLSSGDDDARFLPGISLAASRIRAGLALAQGFGAEWRIVDQRYATLAVCPEIGRDDARDFGAIRAMARTHPPEAIDWMHDWLFRQHKVLPKPYPSGWYLGCGKHDACGGTGTAGKWSTIRFAELVAARPELARFLWLDVGALVEDPLGRFEKVKRFRPDVSRADEWNVLRMTERTFVQMLGDTDWLTLSPDSAEAKSRTRSVTLDPALDRWLLDYSYSTSSALDALMKRFGVGVEAARSALDEALRDERVGDWLAPSVTMPPERLAEIVRSLLTAPPGARWSVHNDIARRQHQETQVPFVEAKAAVAAVDEQLGRILRLRA